MAIFVNMQFINNIEVIRQQMSILFNATPNFCHQLHYEFDFSRLLLSTLTNNIIYKVEYMRYSIVIHLLGL